jgi:hypothetical protein
MNLSCAKRFLTYGEYVRERRGSEEEREGWEGRGDVRSTLFLVNAHTARGGCVCIIFQYETWPKKYPQKNLKLQIFRRNLKLQSRAKAKFKKCFILILFVFLST